MNEVIHIWLHSRIGNEVIGPVNVSTYFTYGKTLHTEHEYAYYRWYRHLLIHMTDNHKLLWFLNGLQENDVLMNCFINNMLIQLTRKPRFYNLELGCSKVKAIL